MPTTNQQLPDQIADQDNVSNPEQEVYSTKETSTTSSGFLGHTYDLSDLNPSSPNPISDDSTIFKARRLLDLQGANLSNDQVKTIVTELQFLADTWLDEFEKTTFQGMSVSQVVNGRKNV